MRFKQLLRIESEDVLDVVDRKTGAAIRVRWAEGMQTTPADFAPTGVDGPPAEGMIARPSAGI